MKLRKLSAIAALLALPAAFVAYAATEVQDGQSTRGVQQAMLVGGIYSGDSTGKTLRFDADGNLLTAEASPDQVFLIKHTNLNQTSLWRAAQCQATPTTCTHVYPAFDSSAAVPMLGATKAALVIRYSLDADSGFASLLAVQVRGHYTNNTDSTNTFTWLNWLNAATDTIGDMESVTGRAPSLADTTGALLGERLVWLNRTDSMRSIWINLVNPTTGEWFNAPYISVRLRVVKAYGSTAGSAWAGKAGPLTSIQTDLIGWR